MAHRPLNGTPSITQVYGERSSAYRKGYHTGVDYGIPNGTAVFSPTNGVISVGDGRAASDGRGLYIRVSGDDGVEHLLYHLARWHVSSGRVSEGQHIGDSDNTGMSTGPHLHWETRRGGVDFNPADWLYANPPAPAPAPTPQPASNQRVLENKTGVYQRAEPNRNAAIIKDWPYDTVPFSFKAYVRGENVSGNDIWYVGQYSGGYFWSGAFIDKSTNGLPDQTPAPAPAPAPTPSPAPQDMPVDFKPDDTTVISVHASPYYGNIRADGSSDKNGTQTPKFIVIHQWDDPAKKPTRAGVISHLQNNANEVSAHYVVDDSGVYQMVQENKRAYHAGPQGNDGLGIECDPNGGEAMYKHLRLLVANIRVRHGRLELKKHSDFMKTECPKYIDVLRIEPISVPPNRDDEQDKRLNAIETLLNKIADFLASVFSGFKR